MPVPVPVPVGPDTDYAWWSYFPLDFGFRVFLGSDGATLTRGSHGFDGAPHAVYIGPSLGGGPYVVDGGALPFEADERLANWSYTQFGRAGFLAHVLLALGVEISLFEIGTLSRTVLNTDTVNSFIDVTASEFDPDARYTLRVIAIRDCGARSDAWLSFRVCAPSCVGRCGGASDGCGSTCNGCPSGQTCESQMCLAGDGCGGRCGAGQACAGTVCVAEGELRFTLTWSARTDVDLHVLTPDGSEISYRSRAGGGGMVDTDNRVGGEGSVENVFFTSPARGTYEYWAVNYSGAASASFALEAYRGGSQRARFAGTLPATSRVESAHQRFTY